jgi:hypothetical protein
MTYLLAFLPGVRSMSDFLDLVIDEVDGQVDATDGADLSQPGDLETLVERLNEIKAKYGFHFLDEEPRVILNKSGNYIGSSMPLYFPGMLSTETEPKPSLHGLIARVTKDSHRCLVPNCPDPIIKASENKFSNGQKHVRQIHSEFVPLAHWTPEMFRKKETEWKKITELSAKRSVQPATPTGGGAMKQTKMGEVFRSPSGASTSQRLNPLLDLTLTIAKFVCIGLFAMAITRNPGFVFLMKQLITGAKLSAPNTIRNRIVSEYKNLQEKRKIFIDETRVTSSPIENDVDLDPHIYHRVFTLQYDCWTNEASEAFLGLTLFYFDKSWEIKRICLGCIPFGGRHTAENTLDLIRKVTVNLHLIN